MRKIVRLSFLSVLAALAASTSAQQRTQDFTLPEPSPTSTPAPQGPVDDSGIIPVGPRVIPTDTPSPVPTETPAPTATPTQPAARPVTRAPSPAPTRAPVTPRQVPQSTPRTSVPTATPTAQSPVELPSDTLAPAEPQFVPSAPIDSTTDMPTAQTASENTSGDFPWLYFLGGLLALAAGIGGYLFWRRKVENAPPPAIKRPVVDAALEQTGASAIPPRFEVSFEVESISRSLMAVMVAGRMVVKNRGERAIRDVSLLAELTSAHHPSAKTDGNLVEVGTIERIGPHQAQREKMNFKLPLEEIAGMRREGVPFFVPLLRLEAVVSGADPQRLDIVLGSMPPGSAQKLQPLRLDGPPGAYDHLSAHPLPA